MDLNKKKLINVNGCLMDLSHPQVMGILNVTPDSFYSKSRKHGDDQVSARVSQILGEGGTIIDVGAYSSRPGAANVSEEEEIERLRPTLALINREHPDVVISVDTFRARVAEVCVEEYGVAIVNDIAAGMMDGKMFDTVARLNVPYIMMHMKGTPQNMQNEPEYENLMREMILYFVEKVDRLHQMGLNDIILDPGFGFGKTLEHNYELLAHMDGLSIFQLPILVGVSRKSMITKLLEIPTDQALNGTTVIDTIALTKGADILRVHDVKEAVQAVAIFNKMNDCK
jgi:dihydropteroate synthase